LTLKRQSSSFKLDDCLFAEKIPALKLNDEVKSSSPAAVRIAALKAAIIAA
jgi:hypothetical protein